MGGVRLSATVRAPGTPLPARVSGWGRSNAGVALVSGSEVVTGVGRGSVSTSANAGGGARERVAVNGSGASVRVAPVNLALSAGSAATRLVMGDLDPRAVVVAWSSSNPAVATLSGAGVLTAVGAGTAVITARAQGV